MMERGLCSLGQSLSNAQQLLLMVSGPSPFFAVVEKTDNEIVALKTGYYYPVYLST